MASPTSFPLFGQLPPELQLRVWEECAAGPSMHVFDVCFPSIRDGKSRAERAFRGREDDARFSKYQDSVFLDVFDDENDNDSDSDNDTTRTASDDDDAQPEMAVAASAHRDPSAWRLHHNLRLTSTDARAAALARPEDVNTVYLPGRNRKVQYDNSTDVLFLRFGDGGGGAGAVAEGGLQALEALFGPETHDIPGVGSVSEVLEAPWSTEMAETVHRARKIALDVAETWTPATLGIVMFEEVAFLACCLQENLEVLYLVDHCTGRCARCERRDLRASALQTKGELARELHGRDDDDRPADVIHGVGKTYREIFDFEAMGWDDLHPTYIFARMISEAVQGQQRDSDRDVFKGVRVLAVEDEPVDGVDGLTADGELVALSSCTGAAEVQALQAAL